MSLSVNPNPIVIKNDWKSSLKWFAIIAGAGIVTGLAVTLITRHLENIAMLAAKAEMQKLLLAAAATSTQKTEQTPIASPVAQTVQMM